MVNRRQKLENFAKKYLARNAAIELSPQTLDASMAFKWLSDPNVRLDGVIAKKLDLPYRSGERDGMQKVKNLRTADCVIGGFRYASIGKVVGLLLLGLYDDDGLLHHVGFTSSFSQAEKKELRRSWRRWLSRPGPPAINPEDPVAGVRRRQVNGSQWRQS
ncbi:MAG: hypothetical protein H0U18_09065 [Pyrinomonadaceae bacterium]|nr:hypothetical protein [Pyrinomonadaceae bacterium]